MTGEIAILVIPSQQILRPKFMRRPNRNFNMPPCQSSKPGYLNFWRLDCSNSRSLGPKWCSSAIPYCGICLSNAPPQDQSSSLPVVCDKASTYSRYAETKIQEGKLCWRWLRVTLCAQFMLRTRNTYYSVSRQSRKLFEWQGIPPFIIRQVFFLPCSLQTQTRDKATDWLIV